MNTCFVCKTVSSQARCPTCWWGDHETILTEEPRYLILESLIQRTARDANQQIRRGHGTFYRIVPTAREAAMLRYGDQCQLDGVLWRLTHKSDDTFWMRAWKTGRTRKGAVVRVGPEQDLEAEIRRRQPREETVTRKEQLRRIEELRDYLDWPIFKGPLLPPPVNRTETPGDTRTHSS